MKDEPAHLWPALRPEPQTTVYLAIRFHLVGMDELIADVMAGADQPFRYIVTPNVHHVVTYHQDGVGLRDIYRDAWRIVCDSRVLSRLARFNGVRLGVIAGSDLTLRLLEAAAHRKMTVAILGPSQADCRKIETSYPGLSVLSHTPPFGFIQSEEATARAVEFVVESRAGLVFLALGMPQQERLAQRISLDGRAKGVGLCIGASIDFLTGRQMRAPRWMRRAGIEWAHRLASNPRRLATRYLVESPKIFYLAASDRFQRRR